MQNKVGMSNIVVNIMLIVIAIALVVVLWAGTQKIIQTSPNIDCVFIKENIDIKESCYNGDELKVKVVRDLEEFDLDKIRFYFSGEDTSIWELTGKKCSDVRINDKEYGGYCELIEDAETKNYIFNLEGLEIKSEVRLEVDIQGQDCYIQTREIDQC